jgi:hypothetical protein
LGVGVGGVGMGSASVGMASDDENVIVRLQLKGGVGGASTAGGASPYDASSCDAFVSVPMDVPMDAQMDAQSMQSMQSMPLTTLFGCPILSETRGCAGCAGCVGCAGCAGCVGCAGCAGCPGVPASLATRHAPSAPAPAPMASNVVRLLAEFGEKSKNKEWPMSTSVHCYWCCHAFDSMPFGLPLKYTAGQFQVVGCFCSLECACAHNFASNKDSVDECLNRYSLANALSIALGLGRVVKPAPDRLALAIFGGHLDIKAFRAFGAAAPIDAAGGAAGGGGAQGATQGRQLIVNCPPMQSLTQQVEEVNDSDLCSEYRYIPLDSDRVSRYQEKIRLMRTKPLINFKNTLDHTMKLKYTQKSAPDPPKMA